MAEQVATGAAPTPERAWRVAFDHVERLLAHGGLVPGDHLPPERDLAARLGIGRSSVREAVRVLEALGLVRSRTGSGPQAGTAVVAEPQAGMATLMRLQVAAQGFAVADVVATRVALEAAVVATLAHGEPDLREVHALLDAMDRPGLEQADFLALDTRLHVALAAATGNAVITSIMAGLREAVMGYVLAGAASLPDWAHTARRLRREHRVVVAAVEARDAVAAERAIREHITRYHVETRVGAPPQTGGSDGPPPSA